MERRLPPNVVVLKRSAAVFELLAFKDESLLVWRDPLLVLNLSLHILDRVGQFHLERDGLAGEGIYKLYKDLHRFGGIPRTA